MISKPKSSVSSYAVLGILQTTSSPWLGVHFIVYTVVCLRPPREGSANSRFTLTTALIRCIVYSLRTSSFSLRPSREGSANRFSVDFGIRCSHLAFSIEVGISYIVYLDYTSITPNMLLVSMKEHLQCHAAISIYNNH